MSHLTPVRLFALAGVLALGASTSLAQRGPGGGGPGGGGSPGGGAPPGGGGFGGGSGSARGNGSSRSANREESSGPRSAPTLAPPGRWWDDKKTVRALNLRPDQQKKMDGIFDAARPSLLQLYSNLKQEESRLSSMSRADLADESKVYAGIDRVTQARAELQKANTHILLQIRKELDAEQLTTLDHEATLSR